MSDTFEGLKKSLGHQVTEVVYRIRGEVGRVLLLGAYPPSNADERRQHDNPTSREFAKVFGSFAFDWLDAVPLSSITTNAIFDYDKLFR